MGWLNTKIEWLYGIGWKIFYKLTMKEILSKLNVSIASWHFRFWEYFILFVLEIIKLLFPNSVYPWNIISLIYNTLNKNIVLFQKPETRRVKNLLCSLYSLDAKNIFIFILIIWSKFTLCTCGFVLNSETVCF